MRAEAPDPVAVLVAARDEERLIGETVAALRERFPRAEVVVADDGSRDRTAERAEEAGARVVHAGGRGKGEALSAAERTAPPGWLLLCDADLRGDLRPLLLSGADLVVAAFAERQKGGFGLAKATARLLIRARSGRWTSEPLSGQRLLAPAVRAACFPLAPGFGCEVRLAIDAVRAGLELGEVELPLAHRPTGRDAAGFRHRGRQLRDVLLACGPLALNYRGRRLPLLGWSLPLAALGLGPRSILAVAGVASVGVCDDLWSGPARGFLGHLSARRTTGVLKLVAIPALGLYAARSVAGGLVVGLSANAFNQLDTRPGRALKAFLAAAAVLRAPRSSAAAVLLLPYDLRERMMLGDAGSNALGAMVGLSLVARLGRRARWAAIAALAGFNLLGDRRSLGEVIERTPLLREADRLGRSPA